MSDRIVKAIGPHRTRAREFPEPVIRLSARERSAILDSLKLKHLSQREQKDLFRHVRKIRRDLRIHRQMGLNEKPDKGRIVADLRWITQLPVDILKIDEGALAALEHEGWGEERIHKRFQRGLGPLLDAARAAAKRIEKTTVRGPKRLNAEYTALATAANVFHYFTKCKPSKYIGKKKDRAYFRPFAEAVLKPECPDLLSMDHLIGEVVKKWNASGGASVGSDDPGEPAFFLQK